MIGMLLVSTVFLVTSLSMRVSIAYSNSTLILKTPQEEYQEFDELKG